MKNSFFKYSFSVIFLILSSFALQAQNADDSTNVVVSDVENFNGTYNGKIGVYFKIKPTSGAQQEWPEVDQKVTLSVGTVPKKTSKNKSPEIKYTEVCKAVVYKSDEKKNIFEIRVLEDFKAAAAKKSLTIDLTNETPLRVSWKAVY